MAEYLHSCLLHHPCVISRHYPRANSITRHVKCNIHIHCNISRGWWSPTRGRQLWFRVGSGSGIGLIELCEVPGVAVLGPCRIAIDTASTRCSWESCMAYLLPFANSQGWDGFKPLSGNDPLEFNIGSCQVRLIRFTFEVNPQLSFRERNDFLCPSSIKLAREAL